MFSRWVRLSSLVLVLACVLQIVAFADAVEGRVAEVRPGELDMVIYDAQGRPYPNQLHLRVDRNTKLGGVGSITDLRRNDAVSAEVHQGEGGGWRADQVTLFQELNAQPTTKNPSPSLRDALGNPVVRGALLGAATGAIAASASHGKAGKGALVGAGVGAAAGLLEGIFSQPSRKSSDSDNG